MKQIMLGLVFFLLMFTGFSRVDLWSAPDQLLYSNDPVERIKGLEIISGRGPRALPHLGAALYDEDAIVKRVAVSILKDIGRPAGDIMRQAFRNSDSYVRRTALLGLESINEITAADLAFAINDRDEDLRLIAVEMLSGKPRTEEIEELLNTASTDEAFAVSLIALNSIRDTASPEPLREKYGQEAIDVLQSFALGAEGWKFDLDPSGLGHGRGWHDQDYKDADWDDIGIEKAWQHFGYDYIGVAWYRNWFAMPGEVKCDAVEIYFGGVDESSWIWINGKFAGEHDIGPGGWNEPFSLDITDMVEWGRKNQITVRVMNTAHAGGIWQPISINLLQVTE